MTQTTIDATATVANYIASWNEIDPAARRDLIAATYAEGAGYRDPLMQGDGHDGIDAMISAVQGQFPGHRFRLVAGPDGFADQVRFSWAMGPADGETLIAGTDVAEVDADGRLRSVTGFIDQMPGG